MNITSKNKEEAKASLSSSDDLQLIFIKMTLLIKMAHNVILGISLKGVSMKSIKRATEGRFKAL